MSVFTDVAAEAILLAGGGRAILLQIAYPAVGYGVADHSDFANRPLDRFHNTVTYTYATVFGSPEERAEVVRRVTAAHLPVHSSRASTSDTAPSLASHPTPDTALSSTPHPTSGAASLAAATAAGAHARRSAGTNPRVYNAFDRRAQLWVAATLYQTAAQVYERVFGKLGEVEAVEVYRGFGVLGTALQVPAELWPRDLAAFELYWSTALTELHVTDDARRVAHDLLHPRTAPLWLRAAMPLVRLLTAGLLPPELRRAFVLPWSARDQRRFDRTFAALALVYPRLPLRVRHFPRDLYLRRLRASL